MSDSRFDVVLAMLALALFFASGVGFGYSSSSELWKNDCANHGAHVTKDVTYDCKPRPATK